eukprot:COSAG01_NODE_37193_length_507_cov_0.789216_2_plen_48_part_01
MYRECLASQCFFSPKMIWGALATQNHRGCESRAIFSAGFQPEPAEFRS